MELVKRIKFQHITQAEYVWPLGPKYFSSAHEGLNTDVILIARLNRIRLYGTIRKGFYFGAPVVIDFYNVMTKCDIYTRKAPLKYPEILKKDISNNT